MTENRRKRVDPDKTGKAVNQGKLWDYLSSQSLINHRIITILSMLHEGVPKDDLRAELKELQKRATELHDEINKLIVLEEPSDG